MNIHSLIAADSEIQNLRAELHHQLLGYEKTWLEHAEELDPPTTAKRLQGQIATEPDQAIREALSVRLNAFSGAGADELRRAARRKVRAAYQPVHDLELAILEKAIAKSKELVNTALTDEAALFTKWNATAVATSISVACKQALCTLETHLASVKLARQQSPLPNHKYNRLLEVFTESIAQAPAEKSPSAPAKANTSDADTAPPVETTSEWP